MMKIRLVLKNILRSCSPLNSKIALISSLLSFAISSILSVLYYFKFVAGYQPYHDIAVGNITLYGFYKDVDFNTYYIFVVVFLISFLFLCMIFNKKKLNDDNVNPKLSGFQLGLGMLPLFLVTLYRMNSFPKVYIGFAIFLVLVALWLKEINMTKEFIVKVLTSIYCIYLSSSAVVAFICYYVPAVADKGSKYFMLLLGVILLVYSLIIFCLGKNKIIKNKDKYIDFLLIFAQLIIPLNLFGLINTRYYYHGAEYNPVYYNKFKSIVIISIIILLVSTLLTMILTVYKKRKQADVSLSTIITLVALSFWNSSHNLVINPDQFHTGETAVIFHQIIEKGQRWNEEFVSVLQGLGLTLSWFNELIFGGTFSTYYEAQNLFMILIAVITVALLYPLFEKKWILLLITPVLPMFWMDRTYLIVPVFLLLLNPKLISNPVKWSYCYIATCIIHVWYQPSYGGAVAASLAPVFLLIWYKAYKNNHDFDYKSKKNRIKIIAFVSSVLLIGVLCIPMLLGVIKFLRANGYETVITNGISVLQTINQPPITLTGIIVLDHIIQFFYKFGTGILALIIFIYMFVRYVVNQKDHIMFIQGIILTFSASISYMMMLPAMFTRIDPGMSRIGVTGLIYFGIISFILLYLYRNEIKYKTIALAICGLCISTGIYIIYPPYLQYHEKVKTQVNIPDDAIYVTPESTGLYKLGYAFIPNQQYIDEAMVLNEICNLLLKDGQTYYDMTDKSIYYLYTDREIPGLYASPLVVSNAKIQNDVIKELKKRDVPLVYINKPLRYLGVSESLRSYRVYRYFIEQDYKYISYKGCNFLVRNDVDLSIISNYIDYDKQADLWEFDNKIPESIYNTTKVGEATYTNILYMNSIAESNNIFTINGEDPYIVYGINDQIDFNTIQLIEINLKSEPTNGMSGQLFVETENVTHNELNSLRFNIYSKKILIPLYKYEQLLLNSKLLSLRLDFDNVAVGTDVTVDSINLYHLDDNQKAELAQEYDKYAKNMTDNRLNDLYHPVYFINLPNQWGHSFELMKNRFMETETNFDFSDKVAVVQSEPKNINININQNITGKDAEFLRLKLKYSTNNAISESSSSNMSSYDLYDYYRTKLNSNNMARNNATVIVKGIDINGNELYEQFHFLFEDGNMLLPIASSPNCLQAIEISEIDVLFQPGTTTYEVEIEEVQFYQLID